MANIQLFKYATKFVLLMNTFLHKIVVHISDYSPIEAPTGSYFSVGGESFYQPSTLPFVIGIATWRRNDNRFSAAQETQ